MNAALSHLFDFLRFPSVSTDPLRAGDVRACAGWLRGHLAGVGLEAELFETPGHPVVVGRSLPIDPAKRTVLIYGHYDVQPVDPLELWVSPPFEPRVDAEGLIFARGSADNKGQVYAHIAGVAAALARDGSLPVNVIFLVEGEEEVGSPNLEAFLRTHAAALACDVIVISDSGMVAPGHPTLTYGLRGVAAAEVVVRGPERDLHSGLFGGAVANPAAALARLLTSLHDAEGRIAIAGLLERVRPLADWECAAWAGLPLTDDFLRATAAVPELFGEPGFSALERLWGRPTCEINGITAGYQGEGSKTVIPARASAKLTLRLVPDLRADEALLLLEEHLRAHLPPGVSLEVQRGHGGEPYLMDPHSPEGEAAQRALAAAMPGAPVALIREGGSIPIVQTFKQVLGRDTLLLGLALPDCRAHAPNENFPVASFEAGVRLNQLLLAELAG